MSLSPLALLFKPHLLTAVVRVRSTLLLQQVVVTLLRLVTTVRQILTCVCTLQVRGVQFSLLPMTIAARNLHSLGLVPRAGLTQYY